jgi:cystathionine beta-lyase/cystathionine gamma-synthase
MKDDSREAAFRFMDSLDLCIRATSLGDVQTLVSHPATSSHRDLTSEEKQVVGISEGMVRISVGIEDAGDLIDDIEQALGKSTDRTTD